jgi:hypothetical protein
VLGMVTRCLVLIRLSPNGRRGRRRWKLDCSLLMLPMRKDGEWHMMFYATAGKPSPNPSKWSDPPYIIVMMRFNNDMKTYNLNDVSAYGLNVVKVKGQSTTAVFLSESAPKEIIKSLSYTPADPKSLKLEVSETKDRSQLKGFHYRAKIGTK